MRAFDGEYLKGVLTMMGLLPASSGGPGNDAKSADRIKRAARWALNDEGVSVANYQPAPLQPVIASLRSEQEINHWFRPQPLRVDSSFLPLPQKPADEELHRQLGTLKEALARYQNNEVKLLTALEFHGSTLAANERHPTIPLFDFIKVTSALAHCLDKGDGRVVLMGGNLSGIQSYLYEIISKRASKLLKGRSFYLHLLSDTVAGWAVENFDLTPCHVLYNSGGGFYVLLPFHERLIGELEDFRKEVSEHLFKTHHLSLFFDIEWSDPFDETKPLALVWKELLSRLNSAKYRRLSNNPGLLKETFASHVEKGGEELRDVITNEELIAEHKVNIGSPESPIWVSPYTKGQIEQLGRRLREAKYWISTDLEFEGNLSGKAFKDAFNRWHLLTAKPPFELNLPEDAIVRKINVPIEDLPFVFYGGNDTPVFDKESWEQYEDKDEFGVGWPKPFDCLAEGARLDRLGVLRMDVDNLGSIFSELGNEASLVRYAALSRALDWFFKGYLNTIREESEGFKNRTIIIYSGGDDLFIIGRWLEVFDFAVAIRQAFEKWTCDALSISGGMVIVPSK
ncbi:MAG: hypothetical protein D6732_20910, partial [Methanobacteriota archaeon]